MSKINIVTPPDLLFNDSLQLLLVHPSEQLQNDLQDTFLAKTNADVNLYVYNKSVKVTEEVEWLLSIFKQCDVAILDIDNSTAWVRDLASYMIAKNKTYWLTNGHDSVYNKVYNLDFLSTIGDNFETE